MKFFTTISLIAFSGTIAFGQTVTVSGTVNNQKGQPVPFAFVRDAKHNYATFTDSTGTFVLKADPASSLVAIANNYKKADVKIDNKTSLSIVLPAGDADQTTMGSTGPDGKPSGSFIANRQLLVSQTNGAAPSGSTTIVKAGFNQEDTRGSIYLFNDWLPGYGISKQDSVVLEISNIYNYDKIHGTLLYTNDKRSMAQMSGSQIKSFSVFDKSGRGHMFEVAPAIDGARFTEVLLSTPKYKIYKKVETTLVRADFHTDGVVETGHRYDEYVDRVKYYFVSAADGKAQSISLKKSTLKKVLGGEADSFIASQGSRDVDDDYVRDLSSSLAK